MASRTTTPSRTRSSRQPSTRLASTPRISAARRSNSSRGRKQWPSRAQHLRQLLPPLDHRSTSRHPSAVGRRPRLEAYPQQPAPAPAAPHLCLPPALVAAPLPCWPASRSASVPYPELHGILLAVFSFRHVRTHTLHHWPGVDSQMFLRHDVPHRVHHRVHQVCRRLAARQRSISAPGAHEARVPMVAQEVAPP